MLWNGAPGGRWSERFLTLTLPHSGDVARDIKALPKAWADFRGLLWEHLRVDRQLSRDDLGLVAFVRVIEVTPGRNGDGHGHIHVWLLSPFVHHEVLRLLWGKAIRKLGYAPPTRTLAAVLDAAESPRRRQELQRLLVKRRGGRPLEEVDWPVIDVRAARDIESELIKYLVKDAEREGDSLRFIAPPLFARIYQGLEGVRTIVTSRKFWVGNDASPVCQCGCPLKRRQVVKPATEKNANEVAL